MGSLMQLGKIAAISRYCLNLLLRMAFKKVIITSY